MILGEVEHESRKSKDKKKEEEDNSQQQQTNFSGQRKKIFTIK